MIVRGVILLRFLNCIFLVDPNGLTIVHLVSNYIAKSIQFVTNLSIFDNESIVLRFGNR